MLREEMNRLGYSFIGSPISQSQIDWFKTDLLNKKQQEIDIYGRERLIEFAHLDIIKCLFQFEPEYVDLLSAAWLNETINSLLNKAAILYDTFGLLNIDQTNAQHRRNEFHRDQLYLGGMRASVLILIPLVDFTVENGATQVVPASHLFESLPSQEFMEKHCISLLPKAGEVWAIDGALAHRAGCNADGSERPAIILRYQLPFLKRPINLTDAYADRLSSASELIKQRLGWDCREMQSVEECLSKNVKFKKGQYDTTGLYYV